MRGERVDRGARYLDKRDPGWEHRIDLSRLDLSGNDGILGQLYGYYGRGPNGSIIGKVVKLGFDVPDQENESLRALAPQYEALTELWRVEILARLGG
jgi:hypothetical protein